MPDMLVQLLKIAPAGPEVAKLRDAGVIIRPANAHEISPVQQFVAHSFAQAWADEILVGFSRQPISVVLAIHDGQIIGFGAYECTRRGFFGPTGVLEKYRGRGIGRALLLVSLHGLREMGYAYAIIGGAGPVEFYRRECGATVIPDSVPGVYHDPLKKKPTAQRSGRKKAKRRE
jgi:predicted N-acetyltransferase YhbS